MKNLLNKLICFIGNHAWLYFDYGYSRRCQNCGKSQSSNTADARWYTDREWITRKEVKN